MTRCLLPRRLIALLSGLAPVAEPIVCGDLTGPGSLLGEMAQLPKSLGTVGDLCLVDLPNCPQHPLYSSILLFDTGLDKTRNEDFQVPATMHLCGTVSSTFELAWRLYDLGFLPEWGSVLAVRQTNGRGQLRRPWFSPVGNIYTSFRLPDHIFFQHSAVAVLVAFMICKALQACGFTVRIKWPNDIFSQAEEKIGGVLVEERNTILMAGVGINLIDCPDVQQLRKDHAARAGILLMPHDRAMFAPSPFDLWRKILEQSLCLYWGCFSKMSPAAIFKNISKELLWLNESIAVLDNGRLLAQGICRGLSAQGSLLLQDMKGEMQEIQSGSVCRLVDSACI